MDDRRSDAAIAGSHAWPAIPGDREPSTASIMLPDTKTLLQLYDDLLLPRMIEERMLLLLRQGRITKWFSGMGQEAISVGATIALGADDYILPLHRNLGVFTSRRFPLDRLFIQWQGGADGFTKGRDRSFHFGAPEYRVIGMISHLGAMLGVADGIALDGNLRGERNIALVFSGDGGTSQGDFHEAVNVASVWNLPVIFLIENNGYGLSTPSRDQFRCEHLADRAVGYGIEGITIDGNDIVEVYRTVRSVADRMRVDRRPVIIEAMTFRMRGHEEASGTAYVPKELLEEWKERDPIVRLSQRLRSRGILTDALEQEIRERHRRAIDAGVEAMFSAEPIVSTPETERRDVYAPSIMMPIEPSGKETEVRMIEAISDGLRQGMECDPDLVMMGQDIAEYGGVFKVTQGFVQEFGEERVRNTPLCESAIVGVSLGLAIGGRASIVEMQFADFVANGFNQIVNNLAKTRYRWGLPVNVTVRMPTGAGSGAGPFHSQSNEAWFTHVPGLKVVYPSNPRDAKGLLTTSLVDPNPVLFFEHKALYRGIRGNVPTCYYRLPLGSAAVARPGRALTIVTYGWGVPQALAFQDHHPEFDCEIIDLRTLLPWDDETVFHSIRKTGRCLVLHEDTITGGFGAEIAAAISQECFQYLDAPVTRLGSLDTPVPFNRDLEEQFLPWGRLEQRVRDVVGY